MKKMVSIIKRIINVLWFSTRKKKIIKEINYLYKESQSSQNFLLYIKLNRKVNYNVLEKYIIDDDDFKWVGSVLFDKYIIAIPNGSSKCLIYNIENHNFDIKNCDISNGKFKWTGGCKYNNRIYGFPRSSNRLLVIEPNENFKTYEIPLEIDFKKEHHYGGVCTSNGIIYQPPRNTNSILKIDLNTYKSTEIKISNNKFMKFRYCGSIIHPNGLIYFLPEHASKVMVFNPDTEEISFIGKNISCMVFDAVIGEDFNIYGFSAYGTGLIKIDVKSNQVEKLEVDKYFGCYGTALGINGKIIGIPGDGNVIYSYDYITKKIDILGKIDNKSVAKCAGYSMDLYGNIYCIPAKGKKMYIINSQNRNMMGKEINEPPYFNGYY